MKKWVCHGDEGWKEDGGQEGRQEGLTPYGTLDKATREYQPSHVFAMFSGGHDSLTASSIAFGWGSERGIPVTAVHINTGIGIEQTRAFVRETCETNGWPLAEIFAPGGKYEEMVLTRGGFPGGLRSHNSMLFYLKQQPLNRWFAEFKGTALFVTGIRRQESVRRMGSGISVPIRKDGRKVWVNPILDWSKLDCGDHMRKEGLARNPVVDLLHRSGECLCGALAREEERLEIAQWFPKENARLTELERECERRGIAACVWAGRNAARLTEGQEMLFSKADYVPLCTSCVADYTVPSPNKEMNQSDVLSQSEPC